MRSDVHHGLSGSNFLEWMWRRTAAATDAAMASWLSLIVIPRELLLRARDLGVPIRAGARKARIHTQTEPPMPKWPGHDSQMEKRTMAYTIVDTCTKDELCVEDLSADCIHPKKDEEGFEAATQL